MAFDGQTRLSPSSALTDYRRLGREQRLAGQALELELQKLADETRLHISVCHLPPGTSKWNKIEHRLFSFISQNWRGKPLVSHEVIVNLISATTTQTGLKVRAKLDTNSYPPGAKLSKKQIAALDIHPDSFHGEWNYTIRPNIRDL
jgi:hypothetical protein